MAKKQAGTRGAAAGAVGRGRGVVVVPVGEAGGGAGGPDSDVTGGVEGVRGVGSAGAGGRAGGVEGSEASWQLAAAGPPPTGTATQPWASRPVAAERCIRVRGAREHNLKGVDIDIPRDRLVVITGLSGSGKSSLAFDTVFAEGQRKYMESLSAYARQFLDQLKKPDIEEIQGLPPTIAIEQRSSGHNPRSTVATSTEIYDYLRVLYARCGRATCWHPTRVKKDGTVVERCGRPITATASTQIVDAVLGGAQGARALVLAPVVRAQKGYHREALVELQRQGWGRVRVNGSLVEIREALKDEGENPLGLGRYEKHTIEAVIDRVVVRADQRQRLAESIESALRVGDQTVIVAVEGPAEGEAAGGKGAGAAGDVPGAARWEDRVYSARHACAVHPECALEELSPRLFSFNSPHGACPACHGLGVIMEFADELLVPDMDKSLAGGAIAPWRLPAPMGTIYRRQLRRFCKGFGVSPQASVGSLSERLRGVLLRGASAADEKEYGEKFAGVGPLLRSWYEKTDSAFVKEWLGGFMHEETCPGCGGDRLRVESLCLRLTGVRGGGAGAAGDGPGGGTPAGDGPAGDGPGAVEHEGLNIAQLAGLNIRDASRFVEGLALSREQAAIAEPILKEVSSRLRFLRSVGLEYLSLSRRTATLSGGEAQRIRLATQVGSGLVGACYVLDEPTIGLHQRDNDRLITTLRRLSDIGNTVLVVEHDEDMIRQADWVVDIGPGPGVHGGRVVACGSVEDLCACPGSVTGAYLSGRRGIAVPAARRRLSQDRAVVVKGARQNNLKGIDAVFPLGGLVCVTGVSGSGKSTLVNEILLCAALRHAHGSRLVPGAHDRVLGLAKIDRVIDVDQSPIGRTPRSNPATYTGAFDEIRKVFAGTKEAQIRGYKGGRFSFNVAGKSGGGRCEACEGQGLKRIEMHFLPDVYVACEVCGGSRYNRETLEVRYRGRSIADVLDMTVEDAAGFFENHPKIQRHAVCLRDVGLGYLRLGQPSTQLSGGEAQRIKLAFELAKGPGVGERPAASEADEGFKAKARRFTAAAHTLYVLDEPTTGLHFEDIRRLIEVLNRLADAGNSLVVIEHNLDVIKCADWVIDLGPEGGDQGGAIVAAGTPEAIAGDPRSHTGRYLSKVLGAG